MRLLQSVDRVSCQLAYLADPLPDGNLDFSTQQFGNQQTVPERKACNDWNQGQAWTGTSRAVVICDNLLRIQES